MFLLIRTVRLFFDVLFWLITIRVILSWIRPSGYSRWYYEFQRTLYRLTEPFLAPIRNVLPYTGMIDFSPLVALFLIRIIEGLIIEILYRVAL